MDIERKDSIYSGSVVITNTGTGKLIVKNIGTGCGCTKAFLSKEVVKPQDTARLWFTYNPEGKFSGKNEEYIVLEANTDSLVHLLKIIAIVGEPEGLK